MPNDSAAHDLVVRTTTAQGLPFVIDDDTVLERVAKQLTNRTSDERTPRKPRPVTVEANDTQRPEQVAS